MFQGMSDSGFQYQRISAIYTLAIASACSIPYLSFYVIYLQVQKTTEKSIYIANKLIEANKNKSKFIIQISKTKTRERKRP